MTETRELGPRKEQEAIGRRLGGDRGEEPVAFPLPGRPSIPGTKRRPSTHSAYWRRTSTGSRSVSWRRRTTR